MGNPRKPVVSLKLAGTYRADRHGDRGGQWSSDPPEQPPDLDGVALEMWQQLVSSVPAGVLTSSDSFMLVGACRWYSLWLRFDRQIRDGVGDPYKVTILACAAWKAFMNAAGRLGLSPVDRAKLTIPEPNTPDPFVDMLNAREVKP